ncbi:hypothetical protein IMZ48_02460, partial [Candidatus Bathyarchaeota archaeon]|nr:hypothetical protein [Candidatus Bathyarchaeota archaeon]
TAQAFAALSIHPKLNNQVNVFIALAPAMSPAGLSNGIVDSLVKASPQVLFLLFGRRSILSSTTMWQSILYPPIFVRVIDMALSFLFGWRTRNIAMSQKLASYTHLYSYTSTKSVVHWFQIIRNKSFQMYDDDRPTISVLGSQSKHTKVAKYPTRNIKTPIVLVYGGADSLVDIKVMLEELPPQTVATEIPHYEHLDFLWARDVNTQVFPHVFDALDSFTDAEHSIEEYRTYQAARNRSVSAPQKMLRSPTSDAEDSEASTAQMDYGPSAGPSGTRDTTPQKARGRSSGIPGPKRSPRRRVNHHPRSSSSSTETIDGSTIPARYETENEPNNGAVQDSPARKGPKKHHCGVSGKPAAHSTATRAKDVADSGAGRPGAETSQELPGPLEEVHG